MPDAIPPDFVQDIADFHTCAAPYSPMSRFPAEVVFPSPLRLTHCQSLLTEEYTETMLAGTERNLPELADGYLDTIYVCLQGLFSLGLKTEEIQELWEAVHGANMSKVDPSYGLLGENDNKPYHNDVGKITKPPGFAPPDIEGLINKFRRSRNG